MMGRQIEAWRIGIAGLVAFAGVLTWVSSDARSQSGSQVAQRQSVSAADDLRVLVSEALNEDAAVNEAAIRDLRKLGPDAVNYLMGQPELRTAPRWSIVLDAVAQQMDAKYSGLYWHTDLEQALAVAKREKKPVLSLRLLGKLTDELSCANSRFFRTTLYPNPRVRDLLASQFVLHWQSVRAVPIITIDFGDGRQIRRTITGNSLHLVLDELGRPVDVLPGLYAAGAFERELRQSAPVAVQLAGLNGDEFLHRRAEYHQVRIQAAQATWDEHCRNAKLTGSPPLGTDHQPDLWAKVALLAQSEPVLAGEAGRAVAEKGAPAAEVAGRMALTKMIAETPLMRMVRNVSRVIHEDSVRNEYYLHVQIHNWFVTAQPLQEREQLVGRVYSELFLSPLNDPWYGLSNPDVYSAIKNDGRINVVTQNAGR